MTLLLLLLLLSCAPKSPPAVAVAEPEEVIWIDRVSGLGLFADEMLDARSLVATWASGTDRPVVDPVAQEPGMARALDGLHFTTGDACGAPLAHWQADEQWWAELGASTAAHLSVSCDSDGSCRLSWSLSSSPGYGGQTLEYLVAPYDGGRPWREALPDALVALAPPSDGSDAMGGLGSLFGSGGDAVVQARPERLAYNAWPADETDPREVGEAPLALRDLPALRRCFDDNASGAELLVETDAAGGILRCETRNGNDPQVLCACDALLASGGVVQALHDTRAFVGISFRPADRVSPSEAVIDAYAHAALTPYEGENGERRWRPVVTDPSIEGWDPPPRADLADCFVDHAALDPLEVAGEVFFGAQGQATGVELTAGGEPFTDTETTCMVDYLMGSRAPCPAVAVSRAGFVAKVSFKPIGVPPEGARLEDLLDE